MNSLVRQTIGFKNLEVIFVNDCSTDNSGKIIDLYAQQYHNVTAIHFKINSGAAGLPRNEAMKLASAEYLMFLDPDDYYADDACQCLYNQIQKNKYDMICGYYSIISETGELKCEKTDQYNQFTEEPIEIHSQYEKILGMQNAFWCKIYKKSIIVDNHIEFPPYIPGQDTVFLCKYILSCKVIYYINHRIMFYRLREKDNKSISNRCNIDFFKGIQTCYHMIYDIMLEHNKSDYFKYVIAGAIEYYVIKALDSTTLDANEYNLFLQDWKWIFDYYEKMNIKKTSSYTTVLFKAVIKDDYGYAIDILKALKTLRNEMLSIVEGRDWLADQQVKKDAVIKELQDWVKQLEGAKTYYLKQIANLEKA